MRSIGLSRDTSSFSSFIEGGQFTISVAGGKRNPIRFEISDPAVLEILYSPVEHSRATFRVKKHGKVAITVRSMTQKKVITLDPAFTLQIYPGDVVDGRQSVLKGGWLDAEKTCNSKRVVMLSKERAFIVRREWGPVYLAMGFNDIISDNVWVERDRKPNAPGQILRPRIHFSDEEDYGQFSSSIDELVVACVKADGEFMYFENPDPF